MNNPPKPTLKKQQNVENSEGGRKECLFMSKPDFQVSESGAGKTGKGTKPAEKGGQKISPPKQRAPLLSALSKTPSIDKAGRTIFLSHELEAEAEGNSFDFGELSSVEDEEADLTVDLETTAISI